MLRLLAWLLFGHIHKWNLHKECVVSEMYEGRVARKYDRYIMQCEHCGNVKSVNLR